MARRVRRARGGRRKAVMWDTLNIPSVNLPSGSIPALAQEDGAFSSILRYGATGDKMGGDVTIRRTILNTLVNGQSILGAVDAALNIEMCIGLSVFDSMGDADGTAINTTVFPGTGPLTDADNSRWYARCCITIPFGQWRGVGATTALPAIIPLQSARPYMRGWFSMLEVSATQLNWSWFCEVDSKSMRKMEGIETEHVQFAFEARANKAQIATNSFAWQVESVSGRHLLSRRG